MKTLAPKVSVALAIFTGACGAAITIANASGKLKGLSWAIIPLFLAAGAALVFAVVTVATAAKSAESKRAEERPEEQPEDVQPEKLLAIFDDKTEIQAQLYTRRWLGKRVRLSAEMWEVTPMSGPEYMISLTVNGLNHCLFFIPKSQVNDYTHIQRGSTITVVGKIFKLGACDLQLEAVQLVKVEDQLV